MTTVKGIRVVDCDAHVTETPDLWTSRLPSKWHDQCPRVETGPDGWQRWRIGDRFLGKAGGSARPGGDSTPITWDEVEKSAYDADERLNWMDKCGIYTQILYPNVVALEGHAIMALKDPELKLAILRANNDWMAEFSKNNPNRLVALCALPFWDIDESIKEMQRCADNGHKGAVWAATLIKHGLPGTTDPYWDRFYAAAQDLDFSVNFHVGVGYTEAQIDIASQRNAMPDPLKQATDQVYRTAIGFMNNGRTIADVIMSGLCHRFPRLNFVSVESGFGFIPYLIEALDWQWTNPGKHKLFPERLLPSEYFRRQVYGMYWFEETTLAMLKDWAGNVLFETDYPHDTSLTPGGVNDCPTAGEIVAKQIDLYGHDIMNTVLWENAAKLYKLS